MKWITRERPKIDRIACPWLIMRFIDAEAEFLYVPSSEVLKIAEQINAIPYDIHGVELSHIGEKCSFDAFLEKYAPTHQKLNNSILAQMAIIVRAADTNQLDLAPQAAGLLAISLGLSVNYTDDQQMLQQGLILYDALYAWCRDAQSEIHTWKTPQEQS